MGLNLLHVIESSAPMAGSPAIPLRALVSALAAGEIKSGVVASNRTPGGLFDDVDEFGTGQLNDRLAQADILHVHGWGYDLAWQAATTARKRGVPFIVSAYGALSEGRFRRLTVGQRLRFALSESGLLRRAASLFAINALEAESIWRRLGVRVEVFPPGLAFDDWAVPDLSDQEHAGASQDRTLLVLGPIEPVWGGVPLLKAFAECGALADGWRLVFAGSEVGDWRKQLEAAVRRKGGGDRVIFTRVDDLESQRDWLSRVDALACVALHPACPSSVLLGLAAGLPTVATTVIAPDGLGDSLIVCEPTREGIGSGLKNLLKTSPEARRDLGSGARDKARSLCDASVIAGRYAEMIGGLAHKGAPQVAAT